MNEVIVSLQQKLSNMKSLVPTEAATPEQISKYFNESEEIIAGILKAAENQETATTTEFEGIKDAIKELRNLFRKADSEMKPLSYRDVCFNLGKALCAASVRQTVVFPDQFLHHRPSGFRTVLYAFHRSGKQVSGNCSRR